MLPAHFYPTQAAMNRQIIAYSKPEYNQENCSHSHPSKSCEKFADKRTVRSQQWEEFGKFYHDRRLTDCLEILEKQGFSGNSAIFILILAGGEV